MRRFQFLQLIDRRVSTHLDLTDSGVHDAHGFRAARSRSRSERHQVRQHAAPPTLRRLPTTPEASTLTSAALMYPQGTTHCPHVRVC